MYVSAWGTSSSSSGRFTLEAWVKSNPDAPVVEVKEEAKPEEAPQQPMFVKSEAFKPTDSGGNPYSYVPETADGITETVVAFSEIEVNDGARLEQEQQIEIVR